jgi:hypothetical protein
MFSGSPASADTRPCTATLNPDTISAGTSTVEVGYTLSEEIGKVTAVAAPEDSGVRVSSFDPDASSLSVNATDAKAGDWTLSFAGDPEKSCSGTLTVTQTGGR